ncbi:MAG: ATP-dependent zinc protease [Chitinophagaceae bacterium]|nr:ATP-dependent zinc protease [Oligoflexus sp.]
MFAQNPNTFERYSQFLVVGWREWVGLPGFGIDRIKAKIDTGARTSSLHAFDIEMFKLMGKDYVRFKVHPLQRQSRKIMQCEAELYDHRYVRSSSGHTSLRPVILTQLKVGSHLWDIELTLTNRDKMGFRMLIGRQAIRRHLLVHSGRSYILGKKTNEGAQA